MILDYELERAAGVEPAWTAWKAIAQGRYAKPAKSASGTTPKPGFSRAILTFPLVGETMTPCSLRKSGLVQAEPGKYTHAFSAVHEWLSPE